MTSDYDGLMQAVLEDPDDDAVRLVFADWFEENDQSDRAELIRLQCRIHGMKPCGLCDSDNLNTSKCNCEQCHWSCRLRCSRILFDLSWLSEPYCQFLPVLKRISPADDIFVGIEWERGFPHSWSVQPEFFGRFAASVFRTHPTVRNVYLTGRQPFLFPGERSWCWFDADSRYYTNVQPPELARLPNDIFLMLKGRLYTSGQVRYDTREEAVAALLAVSDECVFYGRFSADMARSRA